MAEDWRIQHIEASAKTSTNIDEVFQLLVSDIKKKRELSDSLAKKTKVLNLNQKNESKKFRKCC